MIRDLIAEQTFEGPPADVCIVGAGAAGIVLAVSLARQGKRVLLLEGGGIEHEDESQELYQSELSGLHHTGVHVGRFRTMGGSTTRWGGQILELDAIDFEQRPWVADSGWPFLKSELDSYYARAIQMEGLGSSTLDDGAVWREIGVAEPTFPDFQTFFSRWCPETNFADLFQAELANNPLIEVWVHANAVAPVMEGAVVRAVRARTLAGTSRDFRAAHFVWCMGGIETVRFFLQPELAGMPWHSSGLLGRHFQDHIIASAARIEPLDRRRFLDAFANVFSRGYKYHPKIRLDPEQQRRHSILNVAALVFFHSDADAVAADMKSTARKLLRGKLGEITTRDVKQLLLHAPLLGYQSWSYVARHRAYIAANATMELGVHCEQRPDSVSTIQLSDTRDSLGMFKTRLDWQVSDLELRSIQTCVELAAESLQSIARIIPDPELYSDAFKAKCGDGYHHMGGMRMSSSRANGVVDESLKLHGVMNGYICSSAVFPSSGFSNPTHTLLALAIRLADHLASTAN